MVLTHDLPRVIVRSRGLKGVGWEAKVLGLGVIHGIIDHRVRACEVPGFLFQQVPLFLIFVEEDAVNVISLHAVEASKDVHHPLKHECLVEGARARCAACRDNSGPCLAVEIELVDVVEPLLVLVDASENKHRRLV